MVEVYARFSPGMGDRREVDESCAYFSWYGNVASRTEVLVGTEGSFKGPYQYFVRDCIYRRLSLELVLVPCNQ